MKREEVACLIAIVLCFLISFGCVCAVATGLALTVDFRLLTAGCVLLSAVAAVLYSLPKGGRVAVGLSVGALVLIYMSQEFRTQLLSLCDHVVRYYSHGYGFSMPEALLNAPEASHILPLLVVAGLIDVVVAWTVLHRFPPALAVFTGILPLVSCFVVTDTVPHIWALALLMLGLGLLLLTQNVRIRSPQSADRMVLMLALPLLAAMTLLFLLVPQQGYTTPQLFDGFDDPLQWVLNGIPFVGQTSDGKLVINFSSDLADQLNLSGLDDRQTGYAPVLEVTSSHSGTVYLRVRDYAVYSGKGWEADSRSEQFTVPSQKLTGTQRRIDIRVLGNRTQQLLPYYPAEPLTLEDGVVPIESGNREYSFDVTTLRYNWEELWRAYYNDMAPSIDQRYLELPDVTAEAAAEILAQIPGLSDYDTVAAAKEIEKYVSRSAKYSAQVEKMPEGEGDFATWFLESADRGYCIHFATAATVLLRAQGIPARYVEGYSFQAKAHQMVTVTQDTSHAWVEYYVENVGWVVLDATPAAEDSPQTTEPTEAPTQPHVTEPSTTKPSTTAPSVSESTKPSITEPSVSEGTGPSETEPSASGTTASSQSTEPVPSESVDPSFTQDTQPHGCGEKKPPQTEEPVPQWLVKVLIGLAVTVGALLVSVGQWFLRRWWILRRLAGGSPAQKVIARYRETRRICGAMKKPVPEALNALAQRAAFSQHRITDQELAQAEAIFRQHFLDVQKGRWYQKLYRRFLLALY